MNLYEYYMRSFIGRLPLSSFSLILNGKHSCISAHQNDGRIILRGMKPYIDAPENESWKQFDGTCIRCVGEYYMARDRPASRTKDMKNKFLACGLTKKALGIPSWISQMSCIQCHTHCLKASQDGMLARKQKK